MKIGGVTGWQQAAHLAAAHRLPMSNHIFHETSVHLLCATPTAHWLEYLPLADPALEQPLVVTDGLAAPSERPGAGIEWNLDAVRRMRVD